MYEGRKGGGGGGGNGMKWNGNGMEWTNNRGAESFVLQSNDVLYE